jgi:hypothetical protein
MWCWLFHRRYRWIYLRSGPRAPFDWHEAAACSKCAGTVAHPVNGRGTSQPETDGGANTYPIEMTPALSAAPVSAPPHLNAGPNFRVVPLRVLREALTAVEQFTEEGPPFALTAALRSIRIELGHLINERPANSRNETAQHPEAK